MKESEHTITVQGSAITVLFTHGQDYISLTDMARHVDSARTDLSIQNWMRGRETIEFLGIWESLHNPNFKPLEFEGFKKQAGLNAFVLTPTKWAQTTRAIGIITKKGKYGGGTFAHKDIAFEFGSWLSAPFKLYLIKEFQRLKEEESKLNRGDWDIRRVLAKANYRVQTDAIKETLIPARHVPKDKEGLVYASEAEMLNHIVFGKTSSKWKQDNPSVVREGNLRDHADIIELTVLSNLESLNASLIRDEMPMRERFLKLSAVRDSQVRSLEKTKFIADQSEKTVFDSREKLALPPAKTPAIKAVDVKAKFDEMKRAASKGNSRPAS